MGAMAKDLVALAKAPPHENLVNLLENYMPQAEMVQAVILKPRQIRFPIAGNGGGGGGFNTKGSAGSSGIVIARNARRAA